MRCDRCRTGTFVRARTTELVRRGLRYGTETDHRCACGATLLELDAQRWMVVRVQAAFTFPLLVAMFAFGVHLTPFPGERSNGTDPWALALVLLVCFTLSCGGGVAFGLRMKRIVRDRARLARCREVVA